MLEQKVICDVTGKQLKGQDMVSMTTVTIQFKEVAMMKVQDENDPKKLHDKEMVKAVQNYSLHICAEHAPSFMKHVQEWFDKNKVK